MRIDWNLGKKGLSQIQRVKYLRSKGYTFGRISKMMKLSRVYLFSLLRYSKYGKEKNT
jgi:hypothetical protein